MKPIVILKLGTTLPALRRYGDFEDWIAAGLGAPAVRTVDVVAGAAPPPPQHCAGAVLTGSAAMVTDRLPWSEAAAAWLRAAVLAEVPVLGICYGHQLLAQAFGGEVGYAPAGREMGTIQIDRSAASDQDPLLGPLPRRVHAHASHAQSVLRLPPGATRLASNDHDPNQSFVLGRCAWGVQFHPEFDAQITRGYIEHYRDALAGQGADPDRLIAALRETQETHALLRRFAGLALGAPAGTQE